MTRPTHMITLELDCLYKEIAEHQAAIDKLMARALELESYDDRELERDEAHERAKIDREDRE